MGEAEEILDLIFYRPLALGFVKLIYRLPVTPNQVTYLSLLAGLASYIRSPMGLRLDPAALLRPAVGRPVAEFQDPGISSAVNWRAQLGGHASNDEVFGAGGPS